MEKEITFNLRLSKRTKDKLDNLAEKYQISRAGVIRMLVERRGNSDEKE
jgi:predicted DNA-binding protein